MLAAAFEPCHLHGSLSHPAQLTALPVLKICCERVNAGHGWHARLVFPVQLGARPIRPLYEHARLRPQRRRCFARVQHRLHRCQPRLHTSGIYFTWPRDHKEVATRGARAEHVCSTR